MSASSARRVALITGASGGIGRAIAWRLHCDGYAVMALYRSRREEVDHLSRRIHDTGGTCWPLHADLADADGIEQATATARTVLASQEGLELAAIVNNAGKVLGPPFGSVSTDTFDAYFALNVRAPLLLTQKLADLLITGSAVVNVSSVAAHFSSPGDIVYAMSKAALESFTLNAAEPLAKRGVRINTVVPGYTDNGHPLFQNPNVRERLSQVSALGGVAQPESVAASIAFLLSAEASRITGATLDISGGSALGVSHRDNRSESLRELSQA